MGKVIRLNELAQRKNIISKIKDRKDVIYKTLAELYVFMDDSTNTDMDKWRGEVHSYLSKISKVDGKYLDKETIVTALWDENDLKKAYEDTPNRKKDYTSFDNFTNRIYWSDFKEKVSDYINWLADVLSTKGSVSINDVKSRLLDLGFGL